jgi:hypothetical protein
MARAFVRFSESLNIATIALYYAFHGGQPYTEFILPIAPG